MTGGSILDVLAPAHLPAFALVVTRVGGLMTSAPLWSLHGIPRQLRAAMAVSVALVLLPFVPEVPGDGPLVLLPAAFAVEFLVGMAIGFSAAVIVQGAALAGEILAMQMGLSLGPAAALMSDVLVPGIGQLKSLLAAMIYVAVGGHLVLLRTVADSFAVVPPGGPVSLDRLPAFGAHLLEVLYTCGIRVAAPAMVSLLLLNVAVAITSRAVPQIHAILVLFPAMIGLGLIMIGLSLPMVGGTLAGWMSELPERAATAVQALRAAP